MVRVLSRISLFVIFTIVFGYPKFLDEIPNGRTVPDPCDVRDVNVERDKWLRVGHLPPALERRNQVTGKITKNPFGEDFLREGAKFTPNLCYMDSDDDGKYNWEELGFHSYELCEYSSFKQYWPDFTKPKAVSHPGLCEWHRTKCKREELKAKNFCMMQAQLS